MSEAEQMKSRSGGNSVETEPAPATPAALLSSQEPSHQVPNTVMGVEACSPFEQTSPSLGHPRPPQPETKTEAQSSMTGITQPLPAESSSQSMEVDPSPGSVPAVTSTGTKLPVKVTNQTKDGVTFPKSGGKDSGTIGQFLVTAHLIEDDDGGKMGFALVPNSLTWTEFIQDLVRHRLPNKDPKSLVGRIRGTTGNVGFRQPVNDENKDTTHFMKWMDLPICDLVTDGMTLICDGNRIEVKAYEGQLIWYPTSISVPDQYQNKLVYGAFGVAFGKAEPVTEEETPAPLSSPQEMEILALSFHRRPKIDEEGKRSVESQTFKGFAELEPDAKVLPDKTAKYSSGRLCFVPMLKVTGENRNVQGEQVFTCKSIHFLRNDEVNFFYGLRHGQQNNSLYATKGLKKEDVHQVKVKSMQLLSAVLLLAEQHFLRLSLDIPTIRCVAHLTFRKEDPTIRLTMQKEEAEALDRFQRLIAVLHTSWPTLHLTTSQVTPLDDTTTAIEAAISRPSYLQLVRFLGKRDKTQGAKPSQEIQGLDSTFTNVIVDIELEDVVPKMKFFKGGLHSMLRTRTKKQAKQAARIKLSRQVLGFDASARAPDAVVPDQIFGISGLIPKPTNGQRRSLGQICNKSLPLLTILGNPGCGKSLGLLAGALSTLIMEPKTRVLYVAMSNGTLDATFQRVQSMIQQLAELEPELGRLLRPGRILSSTRRAANDQAASDLQHAHLLAEQLQNSGSKVLGPGSTELKDAFEDVKRAKEVYEALIVDYAGPQDNEALAVALEALQDAVESRLIAFVNYEHYNVLFLTADFASTVNLRKFQYDCSIVFVDEGSQLSHMDLVYLLYQCPDSVERMVITGDPSQLGVFTNGLGQLMEVRNTSCLLALANLSQNSCPPPRVPLLTTFRCHPDLALFWRCLYPDRDVYAFREMNYMFELACRFPLPKKDGSVRMLFLHTEGGFAKKGESSINATEADLVKKVIDFITKGSKAQKPVIKCLTGYRAQKYHLKKILASDGDALPEGVHVQTVSESQGDEGDISVLSLVRSGDAEDSTATAGAAAGFMKDPRRLTVAFSRGKAIQIVIGDFHLFLKAFTLLSTNAPTPHPGLILWHKLLHDSRVFTGFEAVLQDPEHFQKHRDQFYCGPNQTLYLGNKLKVIDGNSLGQTIPISWAADETIHLSEPDPDLEPLSKKPRKHQLPTPEVRIPPQAIRGGFQARGGFQGRGGFEGRRGFQGRGGFEGRGGLQVGGGSRGRGLSTPGNSDRYFASRKFEISIHTAPPRTFQPSQSYRPTNPRSDYPLAPSREPEQSRIPASSPASAGKRSNGQADAMELDPAAVDIVAAADWPTLVEAEVRQGLRPVSGSKPSGSVVTGPIESSPSTSSSIAQPNQHQVRMRTPEDIAKLKEEKRQKKKLKKEQQKAPKGSTS